MLQILQINKYKYAIKICLIYIKFNCSIEKVASQDSNPIIDA